MPSVRQVQERVLVDERDSLWGDLCRALEAESDERGERVADLVRRLRAIGEVLGYPTPWVRIPVRCLRFAEMIETAPELGLVADRPDWDALRADMGDQADLQFIPLRETRRFYGKRARQLPPWADEDDDEGWPHG